MSNKKQWVIKNVCYVKSHINTISQSDCILINSMLYSTCLALYIKILKIN